MAGISLVENVSAGYPAPAAITSPGAHEDRDKEENFLHRTTGNKFTSIDFIQEITVNVSHTEIQTPTIAHKSTIKVELNSKLRFHAFLLSFGISANMFATVQAGTLFSDADKHQLDIELSKTEDPSKPGKVGTEHIHNVSKLLGARWMAPIAKSAKDQITNAQAQGKFNFDVTAHKLQLAEELGETRLARIRKLFSDNLETQDTRIRNQAISWFLRLNPDPNGLHKVKALLKSGDINVRFDAASQLATEGDRLGEKILEDELESANPARALDAASALARLKNNKGRNWAAQIFHSKASLKIVRANAISVLAKYHTPESDAELIAALDETDAMIVAAALSGLLSRGVHLTTNNVEQLFSIVDAPAFPTETKERAVFVLWSNPGDVSKLELRAAFVARLISNEFGTKVAAILGIGIYGDRHDASLLMPMLDSAEDLVKLRTETALATLTGVNFSQSADEIDKTVSQRKEWWATHSNDPEFR